MALASGAHPMTTGPSAAAAAAPSSAVAPTVAATVAPTTAPLRHAPAHTTLASTPPSTSAVTAASNHTHTSNFNDTSSSSSSSSASFPTSLSSAQSPLHRRDKNDHRRRRSSLSLAAAASALLHRTKGESTSRHNHPRNHNPLPPFAPPTSAASASSSPEAAALSVAVPPPPSGYSLQCQPDTGTWVWHPNSASPASTRRRSTSFGASAALSLNQHLLTTRPPTDRIDLPGTTNGTIARDSGVAGKGLTSSGSLGAEQRQQREADGRNETRRASPRHHHTSSSASSTATAVTNTSTSPTLVLNQHRTPSPPPYVVDVDISTISGGALLPSLSTDLPSARETPTHHQSKPAFASPARSPRIADRGKEPHFASDSVSPASRVQGLGLSVESRYSRWANIGASSRSQDSLSLRSSERSAGSDSTLTVTSPRTSPYLSQQESPLPPLPPSPLPPVSSLENQAPPPPPPKDQRPTGVSAVAASGRVGRGLGGLLEQQHHHLPKGNHSVDMSGSRARSISSANRIAQPQDSSAPYRSYAAANANEPGSDRNRMSDFDGADGGRSRDRREQDKKTMLSKALQKAHTAVLLDNAQNFEGAIEAYDDACRLLGQVLVRSAGEDDRRKLDAIRTTYTNRIQELHQISREAAQASGKNLPARPMSDESLSASVSAHDTPQSHRSLEPEPRQEQSSGLARMSANTIASQQSTRTETSVMSQPPKIEEPQKQPQPVTNGLPLRPQTTQNERLQPATFQSTELLLTVGSPMDPSYIPPPLSPRRLQTSQSDSQATIEKLQPAADTVAVTEHSRVNSGNSISWLDTIDESAGSSDDMSVHSLRDGAINRKHVRVPSGDTEAEFDAALDAAVEAAYADGMEPFDYEDEPTLDYKDAVLSEPVKQMVDTERKRLSDRSQIIQQAHARTKQLTKEGQFSSRISRDLYRLSDDDLEEERILEEIQKDFGFDFGLKSKPNPPRQSDSSEYSGASTYHSSMSSSKAATASSLSTVSESTVDIGSSPPKPVQELPRLSEESTTVRDSLALMSAGQTTFGGPLPTPNANNSATAGMGVRSRRMSGQNAKQLKIETNVPPKKSLPQPPPTAPPTTVHLDDAQSAKPLTAKSDTQLFPDTLPPQPPTTLITKSSPVSRAQDSQGARDAIPTPTTPAPGLGLSGSGESRSPGNKEKPVALKKNKSSISLKTRNVSVSSPDGSDVGSASTPLSTSFTNFSNNSRKNLLYKDTNVPPTPGLPSFGENLSRSASNVNLFESDLHSPYVPGSPNPMAANAPIPLEPCPESHLLRPYWLMRCFYQTIAHPRGGYLSTKLFVPRDVWRVKGVKIKAMEEKIANCDLLTAGLLKLHKVDSLDAEAVLEEMQQFELVLDQVQSNLSKKLGSDVSVQGIQSLFKDAPSLSGEVVSPSDVTSTSSSGSRAVSQGKSFLSSMRKLRSKSSAVTLTPSSSGITTGVRDPGASKDALTLSTLPMTNLANPRFAKRDVSRLEVSGPHASYMESLARLCDAVQIIDQVARQVEDPGLKHSSQTHVGLELSTRHASEFFGFYICRFVLTDLTMLLDKFIKRGSEWVIA
ncbi:uncharacterized protein PV09_05692 [Verruconis gallopava]|uniref:MIT domain-containing protein n=1 Tax=Verruconis gallopava TaxID=253628 RepID=A0A0D2A929_9PEZI|nr:uncharacterized protein PV09_05692 [Verruconis gallopava]KIW03040.1 hypothetical protein PV09_05692 [Verruconis gallopava]